VHRDPGAQEDGDNATAYDISEGPAPIRVIAGGLSDLKLVLGENRRCARAKRGCACSCKDG